MPVTLHPSATVFLVVASAILLAAPAAAADGEILIDQATVNTGGISPGDAPGFPATLSRRGRYKLAGNLTVPASQYGILVTQHDVTIDLNGFTIISSPANQALIGVYGEASGDFTGLEVMNGTIAGFQQYGVFNSDGARTVVENMRLLSNGTGIWVGPESRIRNSTIANGGIGVRCYDSCLVEQNLITGHTSVGIEVSGGQVIANVIVANRYGLSSFGAATGYGGNMLFGNNGGGAQVTGGSAIQLHLNVCQPTCP